MSDKDKPMSAAEAIDLLQKQVLNYNNNDHGIKIEKARDIALTALREKAARENPEPLTLDQLRVMCKSEPKKIYEPVWVKTMHDGWFSCRRTCGLIKTDARYKPSREFVDAHVVNLTLDDYGKTWLAYANRPNGEVNP